MSPTSRLSRSYLARCSARFCFRFIQKGSTRAGVRVEPLSGRVIPEELSPSASRDAQELREAGRVVKRDLEPSPQRTIGRWAGCSAEIGGPALPTLQRTKHLASPSADPTLQGAG